MHEGTDQPMTDVIGQGVDVIRRRFGNRAVVIDRSGHERGVAAADLMVGDRVVVCPGGRICADGVVVPGSFEIDQSSTRGVRSIHRCGDPPTAFWGRHTPTTRATLSQQRDG